MLTHDELTLIRTAAQVECSMLMIKQITQRVEQIEATVKRNVADLEARISELQNQVDALAALKARFGVR